MYIRIYVCLLMNKFCTRELQVYCCCWHQYICMVFLCASLYSVSFHVPMLLPNFYVYLAWLTVIYVRCAICELHNLLHQVVRAGEGHILLDFIFVINYIELLILVIYLLWLWQIQLPVPHIDQKVVQVYIHWNGAFSFVCSCSGSMVALHLKL